MSNDIADLNRRLLEHSNDLMSKSDDYRVVAKKAVLARNAYDMAKSRARLHIRTDPVMGKWIAQEKEAEVMILCEAEMIEARILEAQLDALKMRLRAVEASLSAVQSQARLLKVDKDLDGYRT